MNSPGEWEHELNTRFEAWLSRNWNELREATLASDDVSPDSSYISSSPRRGDFGTPLLRRADGLNLPLETLRRLPRYLCAMTLLTRDRVGPAHFEYWRCTGAYASTVHDLRNLLRLSDHAQMAMEAETLEEKESVIKRGIEETNQPFVPFDPLELEDLCLLVYLGMLGELRWATKFQKVDIRGIRSQEEIPTPLYKMSQHSFALMTRYGFAVLERFVRKWLDDDKLAKPLKRWAEDTGNVDTKATLIEINSLPGVDTDRGVGSVLTQLYDFALRGLDDWDALRRDAGREQLFDDLQDLRGDAMHGRGPYTGPAVVIATLGCLVFWDRVTPSEFRKMRRRLAEEPTYDYGRTSVTAGHGERVSKQHAWTPDDFYGMWAYRRMAAEPDRAG
jgi:hypothetical protein